MHPLEDTRVIHRYADYAVLAQRYEVMWRDGSAVVLHPVLRADIRQPFLRAWCQDGLHWVITDLRKIDPHLADDIRHMHQRDWVGVVFYTLRQRYGTASDFRRAAWLQAEHSWWSDSSRCTVLHTAPVHMGA